jgi:hypothetical protein
VDTAKTMKNRVSETGKHDLRLQGTLIDKKSTVSNIFVEFGEASLKDLGQLRQLRHEEIGLLCVVSAIRHGEMSDWMRTHALRQRRSERRAKTAPPSEWRRPMIGG